MYGQYTEMPPNGQSVTSNKKESIPVGCVLPTCADCTSLFVSDLPPCKLDRSPLCKFMIRNLVSWIVHLCVSL